MLRRFCDERGVPYEMCGKVIVAVNDDEVPRLMELHRRGQMNGLAGLEVIGAERLREIEPYAAGVRALYSPETGIVTTGCGAGLRRRSDRERRRVADRGSGDWAEH